MATSGIGSATVRIHHRPGSPSELEARHVDLTHRTALGLPGGFEGRTSSTYRDMLGSATNAGRKSIDVFVMRGTSPDGGHSFADADPLQVHLDPSAAPQPIVAPWQSAATGLVFEIHSLATAPAYEEIRRRVDVGDFELPATASQDDMAAWVDDLKQRYGGEIEAFVQRFGLPATRFAIEKETAEWTGTHRVEAVRAEIDPPGQYPMMQPYPLHPTAVECIRAQFDGGFAGHFGRYCQQYLDMRALLRS